MQIENLRILDLLENAIFLSAAASLFVAQFIKALIAIIRYRNRRMQDALFTFMWKTGGMPSSHSAIAVAMSASTALTEGFTNLFVISLFLSLIVIRDALGVRRSAGLQSRALNRLGNEIELKMGIPYDAVKEVHGHTWPEVLVGALLGFFIAVAFCRL